ncbi:MAG: hypothetical protein M4579_004772 [Chaenotheca gracillima]|nr:MAG: hypothetical protein M4579_004772 [Chaenotheca gracillima]
MAPHTIRWGILATGGIASKFTRDLLLDPTTRDVSDVKHEVAAIASSSSVDKAKQFITENKVPSSTVSYGSYEELVKDKNVDVIYVSTPHSHHFQNTMLCLNAGKHVLCEKPFTVNAEQTKILAEVAKQRKLFLMEAVWTRFFPLSIQIRDLVSQGKLGKIHRVIADNSVGADVENAFGTEHRMVNLDLAGGALLDLGIYSLTWVFQILYHLDPAAASKPASVASSMSKYAKTGADESTSLIVTFPTATHGVATTSMRVASHLDNHDTAGPAIRIQGTKGEIQIFGPAYRPTSYRVISKADGDATSSVQNVECKIPGQGMFWEADEVARCLRDGKIESTTMPLAESVAIMNVMDQARKQNELVYPQWMESTEYKA